MSEHTRTCENCKQSYEPSYSQRAAASRFCGNKCRLTHNKRIHNFSGGFAERSAIHKAKLRAPTDRDFYDT